MDPATQIAAAQAMGTLPTTNTATDTDFVGCPAKAVAAMKTGTAVTHWNGRSSDIADAVKDTIDAFWNGSIDAAAAQAQLVDKLK
jgi:glucose/mannose transport system substrate-binding protein